MTLSDSTNNGKIGKVTYSGGFVGIIQGNSDIKVTVSNCTNNGNVDGKSYLGGFLGFIRTNANMEMTLSNCTNNGNCTGSERGVGGFIGHIYGSTNPILNKSNIINNGFITGPNVIGGFIGSILCVNMTISNSTNNGKITGVSYTSGFLEVLLRNINHTFTCSPSSTVPTKAMCQLQIIWLVECFQLILLIVTTFTPLSITASTWAASLLE